MNNSSRECISRKKHFLNEVFEEESKLGIVACSRQLKNETIFFL